MDESKSDTLAFSAVVLASGFSERMGTTKALLKFNDGRTFLEKIISEYAEAGCSELVCTVNAGIFEVCSMLNVPHFVQFVLNENPGRGRLYSVKLGLEHLKNPQYCFIQDADRPFIEANVLKTILASASPDAWCSPVYAGRSGHPVLLPREIVRQLLSAGHQSATLQQALRQFARRPVEMHDDSIFRNINTPDEYKKFFGGV